MILRTSYSISNQRNYFAIPSFILEYIRYIKNIWIYYETFAYSQGGSSEPRNIFDFKL